MSTRRDQVRPDARHLERVIVSMKCSPRKRWSRVRYEIRNLEVTAIGHATGISDQIWRRIGSRFRAVASPARLRGEVAMLDLFADGVERVNTPPLDGDPVSRPVVRG